MGTIDLPYQYLKLLIHFKVIAYGDSKDPLNTFQWTHANLNLPGEDSYTPKLPWAIKWDMMVI